MDNSRNITSVIKNYCIRSRAFESTPERRVRRNEMFLPEDCDYLNETNEVFVGSLLQEILATNNRQAAEQLISLLHTRFRDGAYIQRLEAMASAFIALVVDTGGSRRKWDREATIGNSVLNKKLIEEQEEAGPKLILPVSKYDPSTHGTTARRHHFQYRRTTLHGRSEEKEILAAFLDSEGDPGVRWMVMSAPAGSGKSRIALWLCTLAKTKGWRCGFLQEGACDWQKWRPSTPTLIIVDGIEDRFDAVGFAITQIAERAEGLAYPVRFLLLARSHCHDAFGRSTPDSWWSCFTNVGDDLRQSKLDARAYRGDIGQAIVTVSPLANRPTRYMVREVLKDRQQYGGVVRLLDWKDEVALLAKLKSVDSLRRPLFVAFAAEAVAYNGFDAVRNWSQEDLSQYVLGREISRWRNSKTRVDPCHLNLLSLASLLKNEGSEVCHDCRNAGCIVPSQISSDVVRVLCGYTGRRAVDRLTALEPEVLAQHWVLERIQGQATLPDEESVEVRSQTIQIAKFAWSFSPRKCGGVIRRCILDSASHPAIHVLIDECIGVGREEAKEVKSVEVEVLQQIGFALNSAKQFVLAKRVFEHVTQKADSEAEIKHARLGLGVARYALHEFASAQDDFQALTSLSSAHEWQSLKAEGHYWMSRIRKEQRGEDKLARKELTQISRLKGASVSQKKQAEAELQRMARERTLKKSIQLQDESRRNSDARCESDLQKAIKEKSKTPKKKLLVQLVQRQQIPDHVAAAAGLELGMILKSEGKVKGAANAFKKVIELANAPSKLKAAAERELSLLEQRG